MNFICLLSLFAALLGAQPQPLPVLRSFPGLNITAMESDADGALVIGGNTTTAGLPVTANAIHKEYLATSCLGIRFPAPCGDAYVAKVAADGSLLYGSYIGGSSSDNISAVSVDGTGAFYLLGQTSSSDFPFDQAEPANGSPFLIKIAANGERSFSLRLPSGVNAAAIQARPDSEIVTAGECSRDAVKWTAAFWAGTGAGKTGACYLRLGSNGRDIVASTIIGNSVEVLANAFALDSSDNVYLTGVAIPEEFPTTENSWIAVDRGSFYHEVIFVAAVSRDGKRMISSAIYNGDEYAGRPKIAINQAGEVVIAGTTTSYRFPTSEGAFQQERVGVVFDDSAYVMKLKPDLSAPVYSTFLSGEAGETIARIFANPDGSVAVLGSTASTLFPLTSDAAERCLSANYYPTSEPYISRIAPDGKSLTYSSFFAQKIAGAGISGVAVARGDTFTVAINSDLVVFDSASRPPVPRFCVANAASMKTIGIAPGEMIALLGKGLGPLVGAAATPSSDGSYPRQLGGARVLLNGAPLELLYVQDGQINAVAPAGITAGGMARIEAEWNGVIGARQDAPVVADSPAFFRHFGDRQIIAQHEDGSPVTSGSPAVRGSLIRIFGTGFAPTVPYASVDVSVGFKNVEIIEARGNWNGTPGLVSFLIRVPQLPDTVKLAEVSFSTTHTFFEVNGLVLPIQ